MFTKFLAGGDLMKIMQIVMPCAIDIQKSVIVKYGYEPTQPGTSFRGCVGL